MAKTLGERILWGVALALFLAFILWWGIYGPEYAPGPTSTPTMDVANNSGQKTTLFVARQLAMAAKTGNHGWCDRFTDEELVAALEYLARIHRRTPMDGVRTAAVWVRELQGRWLGTLG